MGKRRVVLLSMIFLILMSVSASAATRKTRINGITVKNGTIKSIVISTNFKANVAILQLSTDSHFRDANTVVIDPTYVQREYARGVTQVQSAFGKKVFETRTSWAGSKKKDLLYNWKGDGAETLRGSELTGYCNFTFSTNISRNKKKNKNLPNSFVSTAKMNSSYNMSAGKIYFTDITFAKKVTTLYVRVRAAYTDKVIGPYSEVKKLTIK